jgi:colanic acid biosynthesis glycosyl transferase WcaI
LRFLILTQYFAPEIGGPQTRLSAMAAQLKAIGHEVEVVTGIPNYPRGKFFPGYSPRLYCREVVDGVTVHRVWLYPAMGGGLKRMLNYLTFTMTSLIGMTRAAKPDYIFVESPPLSLSVPAYFIAKLRGARTIFNVADLWPDAIAEGGFITEGFALRRLAQLEQWSYRHADYVNSVTEGIRDALRTEKGVPPARILFLPNGVDTVRFSPRPEDSELRIRLGLSGKRIFLWAGTLGFSHGIENILEAARLLTVDPEVHILFVGDGSAKAEIQGRSRAFNLENVTFLDPVPNRDLPGYFSIATAGLASLADIPLHDGARPSKMFPALASGKPMIFAGRGEAARLITESRAGVAVPPNEPEALASAIRRLANDPALADVYGTNGRRYVEESLTWSKLVNAWVKNLDVTPFSDRRRETQAAEA